MDREVPSWVRGAFDPVIGEKPRIWRDPKLQGNDYFGDTILEKFPKVALLVSILSPRYVKSEWCIRELTHFCTAAAQTGGVRIAVNKSRLFKVIKTHVPLEKHPTELQPLLGYEFFEFDDSERPHEFSATYGPESERKYWAKLEDLAYDIHDQLESLATVSTGVETEPAGETPQSGKRIYLAEASFELEDARDKIRRELQLKGHTVLPENPLPNTTDFEPVVRQTLEQCSLSVHLLSPEASASAGTEASIADLQRQLAVARSRKQIELAADLSSSQSDFARILWMPNPTEAVTPQVDWLQTLAGDPDFLQTSLEDLKTFIQDRLTRPPQPAPGPLTGERLQVYLDCDERDLEAPEIEPLYDYLDQQFEVVLPDYEQTGSQQSEEQLRQSDAVLIYYGQASGLWLKRRLLALKKTLYGRLKPLVAKAVYLAPSKQGVTEPALPVIQGMPAFSPTVLEPFLGPLKGQEG